MADKLREAGSIVDTFGSCVREAEGGREHIPGFLLRIINENLWQDRSIRRAATIVSAADAHQLSTLVPEQHIHFDSFIDFLTTRPPEGMGLDLDTLLRLCADSPEALAALDRVVRAPAGADADQGPLYRNGHLVSAGYHSLTKGAAGLDAFPQILEQILEQQMYRRFLHEGTGQVYENASFREFVESMPPKGLGTKRQTLERVCRQVPAVLALIADAFTGTPGAPVGNKNAVKTRGLQQSNKPIKRERSGQLLRRLRKDFPDLYAQVLAGEKTVTEAAREAGIFPTRITINIESVESALATLERQCDPDFLDQLALRISARGKARGRAA